MFFPDLYEDRKGNQKDAELGDVENEEISWIVFDIEDFQLEVKLAGY